MNNPYDHIRAYLTEELSVADRAVFEKALESDPSLQQAVVDHDVIELISEALLEASIRDVITGAETVSDAAPLAVDLDVNSVGSRSYFVAAAILLVVILGLGWLLKTMAVPTSPVAFAEVYVEADYLQDRSDAATPLQRDLSTYLTDGLSAPLATRLRKDPQGAYWLAEIYTREQMPDSALYYLDLLPAQGKVEQGRIVYLKALALYYSGDATAAQLLLEEHRSSLDPLYVDKMELLVR